MNHKIFKMKGAKKAAGILLELSKEVPFKSSGGSNTRIGMNGEKALSIYDYSKWLRWNRHQRKTFKETFFQPQMEKATQCWFLRFPEGTGFLDVMNQWVNDPHPASIVSMSLKDGQIITLDGEDVVVNKGEVIGFRLNSLHSVPKSDKEQLWACTMSRHPYTKLKE